MKLIDFDSRSKVSVQEFVSFDEKTVDRIYQLSNDDVLQYISQLLIQIRRMGCHKINKEGCLVLMEARMYIKFGSCIMLCTHIFVLWGWTNGIRISIRFAEGF